MSCTLAASAPAVAHLTVSSLLRGRAVSQHNLQLSDSQCRKFLIAVVAKEIPVQQYEHTMRLLFVISHYQSDCMT